LAEKTGSISKRKEEEIPLVWDGNLHKPVDQSTGVLACSCGEKFQDGKNWLGKFYPAREAHRKHWQEIMENFNLVPKREEN